LMTLEVEAVVDGRQVLVGTVDVTLPPSRDAT
jgi:hypothetical protein